jgi:TPR repeat protein
MSTKGELEFPKTKYERDPVNIGASLTNPKSFLQVTPEIQAKINLITKEAYKSNTEAMFELGVLYFEGAYLPQDLRQAANWFEKASAANHPGALLYLGHLHLNQYLEDDQNEKALKYFVASAKLGNINAMYLASQIYSTKAALKNGAEMLKLSNEWLKMAAEKGQAEAMATYAMRIHGGLYGKIDHQAAFQWYKKAAFAGNLRGMEGYAMACIQRFSSECTPEEGLEWFKKSANAGSTFAMNMLGDIYRRDLKDYAEARRWIEKSAAVEDPRGLYYLGLLRLKGEGISRDKDEAKKLFTRSSELGFAAAEVELKKLND